jgi:hypothetical protein
MWHHRRCLVMKELSTKEKNMNCPIGSRVDKRPRASWHVDWCVKWMPKPLMDEILIFKTCTHSTLWNVDLMNFQAKLISICIEYNMIFEERDGLAISVLGVRSRKATFAKASHWLGDQKCYVKMSLKYLELLRASEGTLSLWSRQHLQSLTPICTGPERWVMARSPYV